jgi:hypothetical protein
LAESSRDKANKFSESMEPFYHGLLTLGSTFLLHILCRKE